MAPRIRITSGPSLLTSYDTYASETVRVTFFEHIAEYEQLYRALLGRKGSLWFVRKMRAVLAEMVKAHEHVLSGQPPAAWAVHTFSDELGPDLVSTMFVEASTWWLERGRSYTLREIATRSALLVSALCKEASTWRESLARKNIGHMSFFL